MQFLSKPNSTKWIFFLNVNTGWLYDILPPTYWYVKFRDGRPPHLSAIPDFFFLLLWKNKPEPGKLTIFFNRGKKWRYDPTLLQTCHSSQFNRISRFFSTNLEVFRFPDSTCENSRFLFCFENWKNKKGSHFVACPMSPSPQSVG